MVDKNDEGYIERDYVSGVLIETPYDEDGEINGIQKEYYVSGELRFEIPYIDGVENGIEKEYYKSGELNWETPYIDGKRNGVKKEYYKSGELKSETLYKDNKINEISGSYKSKKPHKHSETYDEFKQNRSLNRIQRGYVKKEYSESNQLKDEIPLENEENEFSQKQYSSGEGFSNGCLPGLIGTISILGSFGIFEFIIYEFNLSELLTIVAFPASLGIGMFISSRFKFDENPIESGMSGIWFGFLWIIGGLLIGFLLKIGIPILFSILEILRNNPLSPYTPY